MLNCQSCQVKTAFEIISEKKQSDVIRLQCQLCPVKKIIPVKNKVGIFSHFFGEADMISTDSKEEEFEFIDLEDEDYLCGQPTVNMRIPIGNGGGDASKK